MTLKFDHIIHYVDQLEHFNFPGDILKLKSGGNHHKYGTYNKLSYINENYIELLDVEDNEKLKKMAKTSEGDVAFATQIVQDQYEQGFKNICFRTDDIEKVKHSLEDKGVESIGPIAMEREGKKGNKVTWQLLYIVSNDVEDIKPPFFIQWDESDAVRRDKLKDEFQTNFSIEMITIKSSQRQQTVANFQQWFEFDIIDTTDNYTDLILKTDDIYIRIEDSKQSKYHALLIKDNQATMPFSIFIRGAIYKFEPLV